MPYSKDKIVNGVLSFAEREIIPIMDNDKFAQAVALTAVRYLRANTRLIDSVFQNPTIQNVLNYNSAEGSYDVSTLLEIFRESVKDCGGTFSVSAPIPGLFGSTQTKSFAFYTTDIDKLRKCIEEA